MPTDKEIIYQTSSWLSQIVIGENFCPFAGRPFKEDKIRYWLIKGNDQTEHLEIFVRELEHLQQSEEIETSLIIFPHALEDFESYLDFLELADALSIEQGYEGIFQIASFHPNYQFADSDKDDPANFTNRSPYPMLHILREESVEEAIEKHPDTEKIPERNIKHARKLGPDFFQEILQEILN